MTVNSENITYLYDANDSRMYKNVDTTLEEYYLKDLGVLDMKTGNWSYYLSGTERFLRIEPDSVHQPKYNASIDSVSISNNERFYYETDHLGNTRIVFSPRDQYFKYIHFASDFYPYGKILREYVSVPEKYLFTSKQRDEETELDYFGARYYDSGLGKFLSPDKYQVKYPSLTSYTYVAGNPIHFIDPSGDSITATQEGFNIVNEGLIATLGAKNPFAYNIERGTFKFNSEIYQNNTYNSTQKDIIERFSQLVTSSKDNVNIIVVDYEQSIDNRIKSLAYRNANGLTTNFTARTTGKIGDDYLSTSQDVYLARTPMKITSENNAFGEPVYTREYGAYRGLISMHEIIGHAFINTIGGLIIGDALQNRLVEMLETQIRKIYMYDGNPLGGTAEKHTDQ